MYMVIAAPSGGDAAITCTQVAQAAIPCIGYVRGTAPLTRVCCSGVSSVNNAASSTSDRQQLCKCLKQMAGSISGINPGNALDLPKKCGVNFPFKISTSTNCDSIK